MELHIGEPARGSPLPQKKKAGNSLGTAGNSLAVAGKNLDFPESSQRSPRILPDCAVRVFKTSRTSSASPRLRVRFIAYGDAGEDACGRRGRRPSVFSRSTRITRKRSKLFFRYFSVFPVQILQSNCISGIIRNSYRMRILGYGGKNPAIDDFDILH